MLQGKEHFEHFSKSVKVDSHNKYSCQSCLVKVKSGGKTWGVSFQNAVLLPEIHTQYSKTQTVSSKNLKSTDYFVFFSFWNDTHHISSLAQATFASNYSTSALAILKVTIKTPYNHVVQS